MCTPVGHALAGLALGALMNRTRPLLGPGKDLVLFAALAQAPDLDFLPGILIGEPAAFHHGLSHSLGFALAAGVLGAWAGRLWGGGGGRGQVWRWGLTAGLIYFAQAALDTLNQDPRPPFGVPLFWPLRDELIIAARPIFLDVRRSPLDMAMVWHNLRELLLELAWLGPPALLALWLRGRRLGPNPQRG